MFSIRNGVVEAVPFVFGSSLPNRDNIMTQIIDKVVLVKQEAPPKPLPINKDDLNINGYRHVVVIV